MTNIDRIKLTPKTELLPIVLREHASLLIESLDEPIRQQILADAEKAEKWDKLNKHFENLKHQSPDIGSRTAPSSSHCHERIVFMRGCSIGVDDVMKTIDENTRLREKIKNANEYWLSLNSDGIDEEQYHALFELLAEILATKEADD